MPNSSIPPEQIVTSYQRMVQERAEAKWQGYLICLMFRQLPPNRATKFQIMIDEMKRIYSTLIPYILRRPNSKRQSQYAPILIGCPDNYVAKTNSDVARADVNDGWHFNAIILLPPDQHSRFREHLGNHITCNLHRYAPADRRVDRIDVKAITKAPENVTGYVLKHLIRGTITDNDILVLPLSESERSKRGKEVVVADQPYLAGTPMHPGYEQVDRLDKTWKRVLAEFDPISRSKLELSAKERRTLFRLLEKMGSDLRESMNVLRKDLRKSTD